MRIGHTEYEYISIPFKEERKQKLAYIARPLAQPILYSSERVIIFCDGPLTLWDVELFLTMLGVRFVSIHSDMNARKRHAKIHRFNNRNDGKIVLWSRALSRYGKARLSPCVASHPFQVDQIPESVLHLDEAESYDERNTSERTAISDRHSTLRTLMPENTS